jgi:hypothetical protein
MAALDVLQSKLLVYKSAPMRYLQLTVYAGFFMCLMSIAGGCASVSRGNTQTVTVMTNPPAALVVADGIKYVSPADVIFKRNKKAHTITVSKPGFQTITFVLKSHWDAGGVGAVAVDAAVPGGSALFVIDAIYGSDRNFDKLATITLPKAEGPTTQPLVLYEHKGTLMPKAEYDQAVEKDKLFKSKQPTSKPSGN